MFKILTTEDILEGAACSGLPVEEACQFFGPDYVDDRPRGLTDDQWRGLHGSQCAERALTVAARYCVTCPVRLRCLALGQDQEHGVYGGWSPTDRERGTFKSGARNSPNGQRQYEVGTLVRDGETIEAVSQKLKMPRKAVFSYLRSWIAAGYGE